MSDWRPSATPEALRERAVLLSEVRAFFTERGVMEVETPLLCAHGAGDPHLESFTSRFTGPGAPNGRTLYLQTSPEYAMKRLLAAGSGPIYQICKAFRNGEAGRHHNPEFTLLEWYRPGFDYRALMDEVDTLLQRLVNTPPAQRRSYAMLFEQYLNLDAHSAAVNALQACASDRGIQAPAGMGEDRDAWLTLLWTHLIEPQLGSDGRPVMVFDYPASQAMLARVRQGLPPVAERFEVYLAGVELANGFQELDDGEEQRRRFAENTRQRQVLDLIPMAPDERLLQALSHGLPPCSGVALGLDRLLMLRMGLTQIAEVLSFSFERA